ncbi:response regulator transcription factor [Actinomadura alba]|uniref:Response regulator transcription factor n=1 Tax=Actinomadura alba TaxID=406431 RepID=A0ABR7LYR5_9ACTN|nr:response regulator transcription factor [Actinomadura alba]
MTARGAATRVLVVEDDKSVADLLECLLADEGYRPIVARTGPEALEFFDRSGAEMVLLDLRLPGLPGTDVLRRLRSTSDVPVIIVTGRDDEIDRVVGLEIGADDYVTKPFSPQELIARVQAVLRRPRRASAETRSADEAKGHVTLAVGPVHMDVDRHVVTVRGTPVRLPLREFQPG